MKRRLFNTLTILSLILCLATAGLWVRSYFFTLEYWYAGPESHYLVGSRAGKLRVQYSPGSSSASLWVVEKDLRFGFGRFKILAYPANGVRRYDFELSLWFVFALTAPLPAMWIYLRRKRHAAGHCQVCGYDLRATPGRCPECGTVPESAQPAATGLKTNRA